MKNSTSPSLDRAPHEIDQWLQDKVAGLLGVDRRDVDLDQPLSAHGLDSVMSVCLVGELELFLERPIPEHFVHAQVSIRELSRGLSCPGQQG